jgi:hypothetical protein
MKRFACILGALIPIGASLLSTPACSDGKGGATVDSGTPTPPTGDGGGGGDAGPPGKLGFNPSNINGGAIAEVEAALNGPLGDLVLSDCGPQIASTETGRAGCDGPGEVYKLISGPGDNSKYAIFVAKNITVDTGRILAVGGDRPVILVALEKIELIGGISMTPGMTGGFTPEAGQDGKGPGAGKGSSNTTSSSGGGGGFCGKGGNGGAPTATGGASYGNATLIPLQGGSTGGGLFSAPGGGAIQLVAGREIVVRSTGFIDAPGDGAVTGGGAGGAVLLEAPTVKVEAGASITVNGGSGGAPGGQSGLLADRTTTPREGGMNADNINGGKGAAGASVDGTNGVLNTTLPDGEGSASGGGASGYIRINTRTGAAEIAAGAIISPLLTTTCTTQGTLR